VFLRVSALHVPVNHILAFVHVEKQYGKGERCDLSFSYIRFLLTKFLALAHSHQKYIYRIQSGRLPDDNTPMGRLALDPHLARDLEGRENFGVSFLSEVLFKEEEYFGFTINREFLKNLQDGLLDQHMQIRLSLLHNEATAAFYLNHIISSIASWLRTRNYKIKEPQRYFTPEKANKPISGPISRKPDLLLVPLVDGRPLLSDHISWEDVYGVIEMTTTSEFTRIMRNTCNTKRFLMGLYQGDRHFAPCISVYDKNFRFMVSDHAGDVHNSPQSFTGEGTKVFFRIIIGLAFLDDSYIGLDPTMTRRKIPADRVSDLKFEDIYLRIAKPQFWRDVDAVRCMAQSPQSVGRVETLETPDAAEEQNEALLGEDDENDKLVETTEDDVSISTESKSLIASVICKGVKYEVIKEIFRAQTFVGRGTRVWLVRQPKGKLLVMKESWIPPNQPREAHFLEGLQIPNGVRLIAEEVVLRTEPIRVDVRASHECREKRRIILEPAGYHLSGFRTPFELLVVMRDIVEGQSTDANPYHIDTQPPIYSN
jgi:Fungal protein kinase